MSRTDLVLRDWCVIMACDEEVSVDSESVCDIGWRRLSSLLLLFKVVFRSICGGIVGSIAVVINEVFDVGATGEGIEEEDDC